MANPKKVLLVFLASDSGVDGARSLFEEQSKNPVAAWMNRNVGNLIKRTQFAIPPLAFLILASIEVEGVEQTICDLRFEELPLHESWDLVGISVQTGMAAEAFNLADKLREKGFRVVLGGAHVTLFPEACAMHADVLVQDEADDIWKHVLEDLRSNTLKARYVPDGYPDLSLPRPLKAGLLKKKRYFTTNVVQTGRGCPYSCDFCNVHILNGNRYRKRSIDHVVEEVQRLSRLDNRIFFFVDDSINASEDYAEALFKRLTPLNITWFGQATTTLGQQPRLLETFSRSGCKALLVGIESIEPSSRDRHNKTQNRSTELAESIIAIRKAGISLYGSFIYGLDGDTLATPSAILDFVKTTKLDVPGINILRPNPGTKVFERLQEEKRLLFDPEDISAYRYTFGQKMLYKPKQIGLSDFIDSYSKLTAKLFTVRNACIRGMAAPSVKPAVLFFNLFYAHLYALSRHDLKKQLDPP